MLSTDKLHDSMTPFMYHIFTIQAFHSLQKEKPIQFLAFWGFFHSRQLGIMIF